MWVSRNIIEAHHGKIGVYSEGENKGSTFYVDLPIISVEKGITHDRSQYQNRLRADSAATSPVGSDFTFYDVLSSPMMSQKYKTQAVVQSVSAGDNLSTLGESVSGDFNNMAGYIDDNGNVVESTKYKSNEHDSTVSLDKSNEIVNVNSKQPIYSASTETKSRIVVDSRIENEGLSKSVHGNMILLDTLGNTNLNIHMNGSVRPIASVSEFQKSNIDVLHEVIEQDSSPHELFKQITKRISRQHLSLLVADELSKSSHGDSKVKPSNILSIQEENDSGKFLIYSLLI